MTIAVHNAPAIKGCIEAVRFISHIYIQCAFRQHAIKVYILTILCRSMEIGIAHSGLPVAAELFMQPKVKSVDIGLSAVCSAVCTIVG